MNIEQTLRRQAALLQRLQRAPMLRNVYDLVLLMGLAVLLPSLVLLPVPMLRLPLGLVAALLAPGYALTAALFPRYEDLGGVARAALSFGLSAAVLPLLALLLNVLPGGIRPWPIALTLSLWILLLSGVALWRRREAAASGLAYAPPVADPRGWWHSLSDRARAAYTMGAVLLAGVLIVAAASLLIPDPSTRMTEFYALGPEGLAENYPSELAPGQEMQVQLGIGNHQRATARYRIEVRTEGQLLSQTGPITLADGATWEGPLRFSLARAGDDQRIDILLFHNDDSRPYRQLWFWINVRPRP